ncbi:MAG: ABC transporter substrate-binding protein [bacterium]
MQNKKNILIILVLVVIVLVFAWVGFRNESTVNKDNGNFKANNQEIVIGAVLSETGMASIDGNNIKSGIEFAKEELVKKGVKVRVVYEDDQTNPKNTITAIQKLVDIDHPQALIGPTWSFLAEAAGPVVDNNKIVSMSPANTSESVNVNSGYFFFGAPKNGAKEKYSADWIKDRGLKKIAIVVENSGWSESHITPFEKAIKDAGAELVFTERFTYAENSVDGGQMKSIILKAKEAGVDGILYTGFDQATTVLITKKQELNSNVQILMATEIPIGLQKNGVVHIKDTDNIFVIRPQESQAFDDAYKARYNEYPGAYADRGYDSLMLLVSALQNKGNMDLKDYLKSDVAPYRGYAGTYSFDQNGDIKDSTWKVVQVK